MNSNPTREERAIEHATKFPPTVEAAADAALALMDGYSVFRFLAETFAALNGRDLSLSSDAVEGLSRICEKAADKLIDAYGHL